MEIQDYFKTIDRSGSAEFRDRGSKFIAYAFPISEVSDFKKNLDVLKKEHPKATHHCFAYRIGLDGNNFRVSDDGEPSGTAGRPILGQIDSRQLTNTLIVVVRYFGGTLLGVPGLINAYKSAAALALQTLPVVQKAVEIQYQLQFDYTIMNEIMTVVKQLGCSILEQDMQLFCKMIIGIPRGRVEEFTFKMADIKGLEIAKL